MIPWCFRYRGVLCCVEERFETGYESASCYSLLSTTFSVHCLVLCQYITKFANVLHVLFCPVCLHSHHWCVLLPVMVWLPNTIQLLDVTHSGAAPRILKWGGQDRIRERSERKKIFVPPLFQLWGYTQANISTIQYNTVLYCTLNTRVFKFNVQPKADGSQLNLPRGSLVYHTDVL